jgi:hypothetical protein
MLNDFVAYGQLDSDLGSLITDLALVYNDTLNRNSYKGRLAINDFHFGRFYNLKELGRVSGSLTLDGSGIELDDLSAHIKGNVSKFTFNNYPYSKIVVDGYVANQLFKGGLSVNDPGLILDFNGKVNYSKEIPIYNFQADLHHADMDLLKLLSLEKYSSLAAKIDCELSGKTLDEMKGTLQVNDGIFCYGDSIYEFEEIAAMSINLSDSERLFKLVSEHANIEIRGDYSMHTIHRPFMTVLSQTLPSLSIREMSHRQSNQNFTFEIKILDIDNLTNLFFPGLQIESDFTLTGFFDETNQRYEVVGNSDIVKLYKREFHGLKIESSVFSDVMYLKMDVDSLFVLPKVSLRDFSLRSKAFMDNLQLSLSWDDTKKSRGRIQALGYFMKDRLEFDILPSEFTINNDTWNVDYQSHVTVRGKSLEINNLSLHGDKQAIFVNGKVSESEADRMNIKIENFAMENFNPFIEEQEVVFGGLLSIDGFIANPYKDFFFSADAKVQNYTINSWEIGDVETIAKWDNLSRRISLNGGVIHDNIREVDFNGYFLVDKKEENFYLDANLSDFNIGFLNAFIDFGLSDIAGVASGGVNITGTPAKPMLRGTINVKDGGISVDYLNTRYQFETDVFIDYDLFGFDYVSVTDESEQVLGYATGTILHNNFRDWNYDIYVDLNNILALNTTKEMNSLFYGKAYASGSFSIFGYDDLVDINITAITEKNTKMSIPLSEEGDVISGDFVTFIDPGKTIKTKEESQLNLSGINMNFNLMATSDAEVFIIFDEQIGDVMRGRGAGNLQMKINPAGEFQMFGQYEILEGDYLFTLQNVINKRFVVERGGVIRWFGDPYEAEINLNAAYKLRTSLYDVMRLSGNQEAYRRRVPVDLVMKLSNRLMAPDINFEIRLPSVDENTRGILQSTIATEEELNRQVFALMVLNKFLPPEDGSGNFSVAEQGIGATASTSSELLSNQLNNWLSQISGDFDIGINYRPGDNISNEELAVALSTQLFNDRLAISGNFGVSSGNEFNQNPNSLIGDVLIEYMLTEDRKLRLKAFNESNDFDLTRVDQSLYTQGVGVYYQEEFDNRRELFCNLRNIFRTRSNKKNCSEFPSKKEKARKEEKE